MKYNLIFSGIPEAPDPDSEDTEVTLRQFLNAKLEIAGNVEFQNVHRLHKRHDGKPRSIIAKVSKYSDRDKVLQTAPRKLKDTKISINPQYPREINERRNKLFPHYKIARENGRRAKMVRDKLFIDGNEFIPPQQPELRNSRDKHVGQDRRGLTVQA